MMIKKWLLFASLLCLVACSSGTVNKTYYQLEKPEKIGASTFSEKKRLIWIDTVNVNEFLDSVGITFQTSDISYVNAKNHLWLTPINAQLKQSIIQQLSDALPNRLVSDEQVKAPSITVKADITAFHGRYDRQIIISGVWTVTYKGKYYTKPFTETADQEEDGYSALVKQLSAMWQNEILQLVDFIKQLDRG